ncbi:MAG: Fic family protein [Campylobacteraceae bacterium]|jgi:Fic family protein|nr:Fic family protein [Campylobacteraceae bacterium]
MNYIEIKKIYDKYKPYDTSFEENMLIQFNCESNGIEGNSLTFQETKILLETGIVTGNKPIKDYIEALNHKEAIDKMLYYVENRAKLSENIICEFNKTLLKSTKQELSSGRYRSIVVTIGDKDITAPPYLIAKEMEELFYWHENAKDMDFVEKLSKFHGRFEKIHPFIDGNGRTGRLILNLELMKEGYPPLILKQADRKEYYDVLETAQAQEENFKQLIGFIEKNLINSMLHVLNPHLKNNKTTIEQELEKNKRNKSNGRLK